MSPRARKADWSADLLAKYRADPEGFRRYLPEVAQALDAMHPRHSTPSSPFGLTERERNARLQSLGEVLARLTQGALNREEAIRGLEDCAVLIQDGSLPLETGHETLVRVLRPVTGKAPGTFERVTTVPARQNGKGEAVCSVSLVRGVTLHLTWDMHLVSISISPRKVQERRKLLAFVGIARDSRPDVAARHDQYLAGASPHAAP